MAHIPLTQAERALCFVPAAKQFERARERRAQFYPKRVFVAPPVVVDPPTVVVEKEPIRAIIGGVLVNLIPAVPVKDNSVREGVNLHQFVSRLMAATKELGHPVISTGFDPLIEKLMSAIEYWYSIPPNSMRGMWRAHPIPTARAIFCQVMEDVSSIPRNHVGRIVKLDHSTVLHHVRKARIVIPRIRPSAIMCVPTIKDRKRPDFFTPEETNMIVSMSEGGFSHKDITAELNKLGHCKSGRTLKSVRVKAFRLMGRSDIPANQRFKFSEDDDAILIAMSTSGASLKEMIAALGGARAYDSVRKRIYKIRARGQL